MSGRTKRILYHVADVVLFVVLGLGMLLLAAFVPPLRERDDSELALFILAVAVADVGIPVLVHECGHLLFGVLAGMKLARFGFHPYTRHGAAGETAMYPKNGKHVKGKFFALTIGGAAVNLAVGIALFLLWLLLPARPVSCGVMSGFMVYEGVRALIPAELSAGKTDGAVLLGLLKGRAEEDVALRVLQAQGILYCGTFEEIPEALFSAPVVREDLPARLSLSFLEMQWRLSRGENEAAKELLDRLESLSDYLTEEEAEELDRYAQYFEGEFQPAEGKFYGVNCLEEKLKTA